MKTLLHQVQLIVYWQQPQARLYERLRCGKLCRVWNYRYNARWEVRDYDNPFKVLASGMTTDERSAKRAAMVSAETHKPPLADRLWGYAVAFIVVSFCVRILSLF